MKNYRVFNTILGLFLFYECNKLASGQIDLSPPIPPRRFQFITMDLVHRGSYNISDCVREMLNCWEIVKPDIFCSEDVTYESICGIMRQDCDDRLGWQERPIVPIFESLCKTNSYEGWT